MCTRLGLWRVRRSKYSLLLLLIQRCGACNTAEMGHLLLRAGSPASIHGRNEQLGNLLDRERISAEVLNNYIYISTGREFLSEKPFGKRKDFN